MRKNIIAQVLSVFIGLMFLYITASAQDASVVTPAAYSGSTGVGGSVRTWQAVKPETNPNNITTSSNVQDFRLLTQYVDGTGRPVQTVVKHGSQATGGSTYDLLTAQVYDTYGREVRQYLPFAGTASTGNFQTNPFQQQSSFYSGGTSPINGQGETYYYGKTEYENSPLGRVKETFAPGNNWVNVGRGIESHYWSNTTIDSVRIWNVTDTAGSFGGYATTRMYPAGTLYKTIIVDERNNQVVEFKNKEGNIILKKVQLTAVADTGLGKGHSGWLCTYYVYDVVGRLRAVVQPLGVELLMQNSWNMLALSGAILSEQTFRYEYDELNRLILKKSPGVGKIEMVYDARDRMVLMRDSNMTKSGKWLYTIYDALNRPITTGLWTNNSTRATHQTSAFSSTAYPNLSGQTYEQLTETHYDDYNSLPAGLSSSLNTTWVTSTNFITSSYNTSPLYAQELIQTPRTIGMVTWSKVKVLNTASQFLSSTTLYDETGKAIQIQSINQTNGLDVATMQYDFEGKLLRSHVRHQAVLTTTKNYEIGAKNTYDNLGRVITTEKQLNGTGWKVISQLEYNALGQVKTKEIGSDPANGANPLETLNYAYNIRGWLLGVNRDYAKYETSTTNYFGFDLGYDKQTIQATGQSSIGSYTAAAYNGNITGTVWKSKGDGVIRKYDYTYDAVNRLMKADFTQRESSSFTNSNINFNVKMGDGTNPLSAYDANGNIKRLQQWGVKPGTGSTQIDDLSYYYYIYSNRIRGILDAFNDTATKLGDFRTGAISLAVWGGTKPNYAQDYYYDGNGNVAKDNNKDIVKYNGDWGIVYNFLNLPELIRVRKSSTADRGSIVYTYDAAGNKLKKVLTEGSVVTTTLYMVGTFVNDTLQFIAHEEGRIRYKPADDTYAYDYFVKDHLGNVRMVLTEEEQMDQYPSVTFEDAGNANEQLYYENVNVQRIAKPSAFDIGGTNGSKVQLLRKSTNSIGAGKLLRVMSGDRIHAKVDYYMANDATDNASANGLSALLTQLGSLLNGGTAPFALKGSSTPITTALNGQSIFTTFMAPQAGSGGTMPKAYLNILFFDEQFKFVQQNSESVQIVTKGGSGYQLSRMSGSAKTAPKNGYVYVYVSNESNNMVYFDNFQVSHERGRILEETHYYPFGLAMAGISGKAAGLMENRFKFNGGVELNDDLGIATYETTFRGYDPQIGRFWQVDPLTDKYPDWSPYVFAFNDPVYWNDPMGAEPLPNFNNAAELLDYIQRYGIDAFPSGFSQYLFGDDGNLSGFMYDPNPYAGYNKNGVFGLWINYAGYMNNGYSSGFGNTVLNEVVVGSKFISGGTLYNSYNEFNSTSSGTGWLDWVQTGIDVVGLIPVFGEVADGLNALIYTARGDYTNAALSAAAMVPIVGWAATGGKLVNKAVKGAHKVYEARDAAGIVRYVGRTSRELAIREAEHLRKNPAFKGLEFGEAKSGLSLKEARVLEQTLINENGGVKGGQLLNKINSIAPSKWESFGVK